MDVQRLRGRADRAVPAQELLERREELGAALRVVLGELPDRVDGRVADPAVDGDAEEVLVGAEIVVGERRSASRLRTAVPTSACCASAKPSAKAASPLADARHADRDRLAELLVHPTQRARGSAALEGVVELDERAERVLAVVEERSRAPRTRSARASASLHGSATSTTCGWSRSHPSRAARPSRSPRERPPASSSKKSLIRFFSVSCSITCTFLIPTATWLATARPSSTRALPSATSRPISSPFATSGTASRVLRPPRASSGPSSASPSVWRALPGSGSLALRSSSSLAGSSRYT